MWLKCNHCGNVYSNQSRSVGGTCGVDNCTGKLVVLATMQAAASSARLDLRCQKCGNVYSSSSSGKHIYGTCGVNGCFGKLDRYWG
ncbi:MAG TPA: hypothetical protein VMY05_00830 [Acidobacteriota bacterium]|nr:hypothetical protein [Acidobacteriota bacterium]